MLKNNVIIVQPGKVTIKGPFAVMLAIAATAVIAAAFIFIG